MALSRYLVKTKYTYEKIRQTDYSYKNEFVRTQNIIYGRYMYKSYDEIFSGIASNKKSIAFDISSEISKKFSEYTGIKLTCDGQTTNGLIKISFFNGDESFSSVCNVNEALSPIGACFYLKNMSFLPTRAVIECSDDEVRNITVSFLDVLNYLGEWGGQANFYKAHGCEIKDNNGAVDISLCGNGYIETPMFPDSSDTVYNMLMPRRNTVFAVITSEPNVKSARVSYITTTHGEYSDDASLSLPLISDGLPHAYYFNLSATKNCDGRLLQLRFEFEGEGNVTLNRYSFEEEKPVFNSGAVINSCIASKEDSRIYVKGSLKDDVCDGEVCLYMTVMSDENYESIEGKTFIGAVNAKKNFEFSFDLYDDKTSRIMYQFLLFLKRGDEYIRLTDRFYCENYEVFKDNPYSFELPNFEVSVLDFGAYGDAYHNDTDAIQNALNYVYKNGGGKVIIPGSSSVYGRRYIVTNLLIRSNTELHFEDGAVLWQSQVREDYPYEVVYGHDAYIPGVNWTHNMHVSHLPLLQVANSHHVKVTGHGKLRGMDIGSEEGVDMKMRFSTGCVDRIHIIMLGFFGAEYVECRDFEIVRCNNYHSAFYHCEKVYCANLKYHEAKCLSGDGFGLIAGTHDVLVNRCFFQSNDDCIVLTSVANDPRGILWWTNAEDIHSGPYDITACYSYLNAGTGKSIAFITWGTNDKIQEKTEICGIRVYGNYIIATNPIGAWHDNPYNGRVPFDNMEMDDYSPVRDVRILHNRYEGNCTLGPIRPTDFISDCGINSSSDFENGDFTLGGLANWTAMRNASDESVKTVIYANKEKGCIDCFEFGDVSLCEGLYLTCGEYIFDFELMTGVGGALMFAKNMENDEEIFNFHVESVAPKMFSCVINVERDGNYYVGVKNFGSFSENFAIIDKCKLTKK